MLILSHTFTAIVMTINWETRFEKIRRFNSRIQAHCMRMTSLFQTEKNLSFVVLLQRSLKI